jgi:N-methylhydantoinase A
MATLIDTGRSRPALCQVAHWASARCRTWRVRVRGPSPALADHLPETGALEPFKGTRRIWSQENGEFVEAPVLDRYLLRPGYTIEGPVVVEERESTAVMGAGARGTVDGHGNIWVEIDA